MREDNLKSKHISEISYDLMEEMEILSQNADKITGISTGIEVLDKELEGINCKDLVFIGSYPLSYEWPFILRLVISAAEKFKNENSKNQTNKNVLFFNLDSCLTHDVKALIRFKNNLAVCDLNDEPLSYKQFEKIMNFKKEIDDMPIYFNNSRFCFQDIQDEVQRLGYENVGLVVIESLQELNDYQENKDLRPLFLELKNFADRHNIPIGIACRLNETGDFPALKDMPCHQASTYMDKILFLKARRTNEIEPIQAEFDTFEKYQQAYKKWDMDQKQNKDKCDIIVKKAYKWKHKELTFHFDSDFGRFDYIEKEENYELKALNEEIDRHAKQLEENIVPNCIFSPDYKSFMRFNPELINTDMDLNRFDDLVKQSGKLNFSLCLYGASGTGKTAYANHLAEVLGLKAITKRCSDLLMPFVGETESKIAGAFKKASDEKAVLIFDEADSFLQNRSKAVRNWEITQVNEMLTQMEKHPYPIICTTNLMENIDEASLRRFTFKIKYDYMTNEQIKLAFRHFFNMNFDEDCNLKLTPGDFKVVRQKADILGLLDNKEKLLEMLRGEQEHREPLRHKIGFI